MARNTKIQLRRGTAAQWSSSGATLAEGEIGYEIDTGRFKIGKTGGSLWSVLPYAGGSDILPGTGIATLFDGSLNAYTISSVIESSGNGLSLSRISFPGNGLTAPSGSYYSIGLSNRLQNLSNLNTSGIIVGTNSSGVITRGLDEGANIDITNPSGIQGNPVISLSPNLSVSSVDITGVNGNLGVSGTATINDLYIRDNITIDLAAAIIANGTLVFNANPFVVNGSGIFTSGLFVGPSGSPTGVSLSGHKHAWTDITNLTGFCDSVADCVDTSLSASTGIQLSYDNTSNSLGIALSGQALRLHNLNTNGLIVRKSASEITSVTIGPSGSNILVGNGNGVNDNPSIGLNPNVSINSLSTDATVTVGTDLLVQGNLVVNGETVTTNVSAVTIEDPTIKLGQPSGALSDSDFKDRGVEFVYRRSGTIPITGFFGYDHSADAFVFLKDSVNNNEVYSGVSGLVNVGGLYSAAGVSGTILTSTVTSPTAPIVVSSTGQVNNLNADLLDGQHGSYYRNWGSITGLATPTYTVTLTGDVSGTATSSATTLGNNVSLSINTTLNGNNSVTLGVETTGQYARTVLVAGTGLSATLASADDGTDYTITSNATPANITGTLVARNTIDGGFAAGTVTASGFVGYGGSITGLYANNLSSGTVPSGRLTGDYNINVLGSAGSTTGTLTFSSAGNGNTDSFNGSLNKTLSYNSIGSPSTTGHLASGNNWNISILGNAATSTNATNASGIYISSTTSTDTLTSIVLVGAQTANSQQPFIDSGLSYNANTDTLNVYNISGLYTNSIYGSTSISGILGSPGDPASYLHNFVIDGGSP